MIPDQELPADEKIVYYIRDKMFHGVRERYPTLEAAMAALEELNHYEISLEVEKVLSP